MATCQDLIKSSLRLIGVLGTGESASSQEEADAFVELNRIISSWSAEDQIVYNKFHQPFTLVAGDSTYTMGPAGNFATSVRPVQVVSAATISGEFRQPMEVLPYQEAVARHANSVGLRATLPNVLGVDNGFPLLNLIVLPTPFATSTIEIDSFQPIPAFALVTDAISMPPGYEMALQYELALRLVPEYPPANGRRLTEDLLGQAQKYKMTMVSPTIKQQPQGQAA